MCSLHHVYPLMSLHTHTLARPPERSLFVFSRCNYTPSLCLVCVHAHKRSLVYFRVYPHLRNSTIYHLMYLLLSYLSILSYRSFLLIFVTHISSYTSFIIFVSHVLSYASFIICVSYMISCVTHIAPAASG